MGLGGFFQDEPKLKKWTLYLVIACLVVSIVMIVWYVLRYNESGTNPEISGIFSIIHVVAYICLAVVTGLALYGTYSSQCSQFLLWYCIGCLCCALGELVCLIWNQFITKLGKQYGWILMVVKIAIIIFVMVCALFVYLLKRLRANQSGNPVTAAKENLSSAEKALEAPPEKKTAATKK